MWWIEYARAPFLELGRTPQGWDCWGALKWVFEHDHPDKIILPGYEEFYEDTNSPTLAQVIERERELAGRWHLAVPVIDGIIQGVPKMFDVPLMRMRGVPMHVGIVTKPWHMLHCVHGVGTSHEAFNTMRWRHKIAGFYRYEKS